MRLLGVRTLHRLFDFVLIEMDIKSKSQSIPPSVQKLLFAIYKGYTKHHSGRSRDYVSVPIHMHSPLAMLRSETAIS
jgi:hypothetical protein